MAGGARQIGNVRNLLIICKLIDFINQLNFKQMNKSNILAAAAAILTLASCQNDETLKINNGEGIAFRTAMTTKAAEVTTENLKEFWVTAYDGTDANNYFTAQKYTKNEGNSHFESDPVYYWPDDALTFQAYAPEVGTVSINKNEQKVTGFTPNTNISQQVDFITATATGNKTDNEGTGVALTFGHRLSQIKVMAKNGNIGYKISVRGVRIGSVSGSGDFSFANNSWDNWGEKVKYEVLYKKEARDLNDQPQSLMSDTADDNAMLIPQQLTAWEPTTDGTNDSKNSYISVLVTITTAAGAHIYSGWAAVGIDENWEANKKYVYTLDFSNGAGNVDPEGPGDGEDGDKKPGDEIFGDPIFFTVTVTPWETPETGVDVPLK